MDRAFSKLLKLHLATLREAYLGEITRALDAEAEAQGIVGARADLDAQKWVLPDEEKEAAVEQVH